MNDIVERLRMTASGVPICGEAADEIERLRAALESLTKDPPATLDEPDTDAEVVIKMRAIAREALDRGLPTAEDVRGILRTDNEQSMNPNS